MHRLYIKWCDEKSYSKENFEFYKRVFRRRFDLKFQQLKKDECNQCAAYNALTEKTEAQKLEQSNHLEDKEITRRIKQKLKEEARSNKNVVTAAFDLEQVLLTPFGSTGAFYYSRRLKNHNLTVTEIDSMKTHAYLWNEYEAKKGSCEVASAVRDFIKKVSANGEESKVANLFSDKCGGQNLNRMVFVMLSNVLIELQLEKIEMIFLVSGHSQNENDNAHSVIEMFSKKRFIYTTSEWEWTIKEAFKKNDCDIKVMMHDDILNFRSAVAFPEYADVLNDKCFILDSEGKKKKVMWSSIKQVMFRITEPTKLFFKYDYKEEYQSCVFRIEKATTRNAKPVNQRLYEKPVGIAQRKKDDLMKLCNKHHIPKQHHAFYEAFTITHNKDDDDNHNATIRKGK